MNVDRLKLARIEAGHTQESLAELLNIDTRQIWRYENSESEPKGDMVARLARALNVSTDYLLDLTGDPTPHDMESEQLTSIERAVISAWRQGQPLEAIRIISDEGLKKIAIPN